VDTNSPGIGQVHVWRASLDLEPTPLAALAKTLSADEMERADRFYFTRDRQRFIAGRGLLRQILAEYLRSHPAQLRFTYNDYGKPDLVQSGHADALRFNLSHTNGIAVLALSRERQVGIDIETLRDDLGLLEIADNFFSRDELSRLRALPAYLQCHAFLKCWVSKEAYIKARGMGLSIPLDSFDVALNPGSPAELLATIDPSDLQKWKLEDLAVGDSYIAAIAAEGKDWIVQQRDWNGADALNCADAL
jgi:4'-phosphopantetheinyl transferase